MMNLPYLLRCSLRLSAFGVALLACRPSFAVSSPTLPTFQAELASEASGLCVTVPGAAATSGLVLSQSACATSSQQYFSFIPQADGSYVYHSPVSTNLCVDLNDYGVLVQNYCLATASQKWLGVANPDGSYSLKNEQSHGCLAATPAAGTVPAGFSTAACAESAAQKLILKSPQYYTAPATPTNRTAPVTPVTPTLGQWQAGYFHGLPYRILFPAGYDPTHFVYPLVLFLHGDGQSGTDNLLQLQDVPTMLAADYDMRSKVPLIILAPQCPTTDIWGNPWSATAMPTETLTVELTQMLVSTLPVDPERVSVTGLSMGGIGAWDMINRYASLFGVAAPIAGAGNAADAPNLVNVPILALHGGADTDILPVFDEEMYAAIHAVGGKMLYLEIPGAEHDVWDVTYYTTLFWQWLASQKHD